MEANLRQVTIIDELWNNEEVKANRRLYDEQDRGLQRQNIELHDRIKKFEKQLEVLKHNQLKDHDKELIKRVLSKQGNEYNKLLTKKDQEIEQLNEQIKQLSKPSLLETALRQANIERLHLEKRFLSSSSSLNSTTTTSLNPTTAATSTITNEERMPSPKSVSTSTGSDDPIHYKATEKMNEELKSELHRLTYSYQENMAKVKLQVERYNELQQAYKNLETKYNQLLTIEELYAKEKSTCDAYLRENEQLKEKLSNMENELNSNYLEEQKKQKEKIDSLESEILSLKSTQGDQKDLQITIERLKKDLETSVRECDTISTLNTQLRNELKNATNTNERLMTDGETLRRTLISKSDEIDSKQRENEQLKVKNADLESIIKSLQDANDLLKRLNDENEMNKHELKKKQDDYEQFQKMHDVTKLQHQATIHQLQEKIHDLEHKIELQSLKHAEILLQFETLKAQQQQQLVLPSSVRSSPSLNSHHNAPATVVDSQTSARDDSAPISSRPPSRNLKDKLPRVVVAKYSYEPLRYSPNDHPEVELPLKLGEYYIAYGNIDEDGFYDGRNLEGRYGLIPSNFVEVVKNPNELPENAKQSVQKLVGNTFLTNERSLNNRDSIFGFESDPLNMNSSISIPAVRTPTDSNTSDITNSDLSFGKHIPHPINLRIEKFINQSVLLAWNPPLSNMQVLGYQVIFDHTLYTTIPAGERTRAVIENINFNEKLHRICIRTMTQLGQSRDQECTLLFTNSKELSYVPTDLRVDRISQTTAVVSWWPASSDISHKLLVNDKDVQTFRPGVYRFKLKGLSPNSIHKVTIKSKPPILSSVPQQTSVSLEFRTAPFDDSIEPPRRVQAIMDTQSNTVRLSWEPLSTINKVHGYRILVDGRQILDINSPLNDHAVMSPNILQHGRVLTVRTLTDSGGESNDSLPIDIDDILRKSPNIILRKSSAPPIPTGSPGHLKSPSNEKEIAKSLARSSLGSPSTISSASTDIPQIDLSPHTPTKSLNNKVVSKQSDFTDSNRIRTPSSESSHMNKSPLSGEQRTISTMPSPIPKLQPSSSPKTETNHHLLDKTNALPRLFIALYDYDPQEMSPNQNSEEELPFKQGQIIKIYGEQDADGFYIGQTDNGHIGYVPSNMVSEVETNDAENESVVNAVPSKKQASSKSPTPTTTKKPIKKMQALFDYDANEYSPNAESHDELSFHAGDIIFVHGSVRDDGFYAAELEDGKKGLVPSNYLKEVQDENSTEKSAESDQKKQTPTNVNIETKIEAEQPIKQPSPSPSPADAPATTTPSAEATKGGFFSRLKNTFTRNPNEPK